MYLRKLQRMATECNRPFADVVAVVDSLRDAYKRHPGIIHRREREAVMRDVGSDEALHVLTHCLLKEFVETDFELELMTSPEGTRFYQEYKCSGCGHKWTAVVVLSMNPACPGCVKPAEKVGEPFLKLEEH